MKKWYRSTSKSFISSYYEIHLNENILHFKSENSQTYYEVIGDKINHYSGTIGEDKSIQWAATSYTKEEYRENYGKYFDLSRIFDVECENTMLLFTCIDSVFENAFEKQNDWYVSVIPIFEDMALKITKNDLIVANRNEINDSNVDFHSKYILGCDKIVIPVAAKAALSE